MFLATFYFDHVNWVSRPELNVRVVFPYRDCSSSGRASMYNAWYCWLGFSDRQNCWLTCCAWAYSISSCPYLSLPQKHAESVVRRVLSDSFEAYQGLSFDRRIKIVNVLFGLVFTLFSLVSALWYLIFVFIPLFEPPNWLSSIAKNKCACLRQDRDIDIDKTPNRSH